MVRYEFSIVMLAGMPSYHGCQQDRRNTDEAEGDPQSANYSSNWTIIVCYCLTSSYCWCWVIVRFLYFLQRRLKHCATESLVALTLPRSSTRTSNTSNNKSSNHSNSNNHSTNSNSNHNSSWQWDHCVITTINCTLAAARARRLGERVPLRSPARSGCGGAG